MAIQQAPRKHVPKDAPAAINVKNFSSEEKPFDNIWQITPFIALFRMSLEEATTILQRFENPFIRLDQND